MKIKAGAMLGMTINLGDYESAKPSFWCEVEREVPSDLTTEKLGEEIVKSQDFCRTLCENQIEQDLAAMKFKKQLKGI